MEVTRRSVLLEALEQQEAMLAKCSVNGRKQIPLPGMKDLFREQFDKCVLLREMIQALDSEQVRSAIAGWQREIMDGKGVDVTMLDKVPPIDGQEDQTRMVF